LLRLDSAFCVSELIREGKIRLVENARKESDVRGVYPSYYSLLSSNVTKYSTRASRSNTGTYTES
jgi:hypothetical protein